MKCVGFAIPPIVENTLEGKPAIPSLGAFTYFRFSEGSIIPLEHIKTSCLQPMSIYNTLTQGGDNYFNLALINFASMNKTKFHAIPSLYSFLIIFDVGGVLECQLGR
jgi:hypothetical protein